MFSSNRLCNRHSKRHSKRQESPEGKLIVAYTSLAKKKVYSSITHDLGANWVRYSLMLNSMKSPDSRPLKLTFPYAEVALVWLQP
jgi:hypothetical protein